MARIQQYMKNSHPKLKLIPTESSFISEGEYKTGQADTAVTTKQLVPPPKSQRKVRQYMATIWPILQDCINAEKPQRCLL
jgi:hypothetical protein